MRWLLSEMDARYRRFAERKVRDIHAFNRASPAGEAPLPVLVVAVDEMADLMMTAPDEFEPLVTRIAQMGRATGIHLMLATQRPSVDVLTGLIKANIPARIAFAVASQADSRVILDQPGAEKLLGRGDMLFLSPDAPRPRRVQGTHVSDDELDRLSDFWAGSHWLPPKPPAPWYSLVESFDADDPLFEKAAALSHDHRRMSASFLQRRLRIGYRKARELYDRLEDEGLIGEAPGSDEDDGGEGGEWTED
jgi:S-DNA-T family DNA segregation ATPase FtsK/SpoIIIE